mmetsp:Transcript_20970/g.42815  ORF Transcript_20970/g.42815 Transcript_20970/m.42815 type:complete len:487 (-) Transcript_20970:96-1556(-)|eukprot:CAMPEP_0178696066 /NCGR_PEP_ID=MMETSP0699-20121125/9207_1 /TAXON_ID=265572 /ORGANISM="Extubocellulus spinifer, Strain CCMP396" /LENGTH=486 /DNA_ID=CAMNT_0020341839 /DNA_START=921 /DNA_END=2381 /DNA_ORIENTATION=+
MATSRATPFNEWRKYLTSRDRNDERNNNSSRDVSKRRRSLVRRIDTTFVLVVIIYTVLAISIGVSVERMRGRAITHEPAGRSGTSLDSRRLTDSIDPIQTEVDDALATLSEVETIDNEDEDEEGDLGQFSVHDNDRAIYLISMGEKAEDISLIQRCLISIRRKGKWRGYVIVLTNVKYQQMYQDKLGTIDSYLYGDDSHIVVLHPTMEHLQDTLANAKRDSMKIKRFKTRALDVLDQDSRLADVEMLIYLDIDIVVGRDINSFLNYARKRYNYGATYDHEQHNDVGNSSSSNSVTKVGVDEKESRIYLFEDMNMPLHGGITLVERGSSEYCLEKWRSEQDKNPKQVRSRVQFSIYFCCRIMPIALCILAYEYPYTYRYCTNYSPKAYDQVALLHIWNQNQSGDTKCRVVQMKRTKKNLVFPTEGKMRTLMETGRSFPTFVHVTNNQRAGKIPDDVQNEFYSKVLELTDQERNSISSLLGKMIKGSA